MPPGSNSHIEERYLVFVDQADKAGMWPIHELATVRIEANGVLDVLFTPGSNGVGTSQSVDKVALTITADKEREVMLALGKTIVDGGESVIVVCDDVASEFLHPDILSCVITFGD